MRIEIAAGGRARPGETECGDVWGVVSDHERRCHLVVLADGLGHGPEAAAAGRAAVAYVTGHAWAPLNEVMRGCHAAVSDTRGAAVSILRLDGAAREACFCGIGNVEVVSASTERVRPVPLPGVVGGRLRKVVENRFSLHGGDIFILHSDGVSSRFEAGAYRGMDPSVAVRRLLAAHAKDHDDASCIIVQC
jgi:phosphoserine phosphatase RsbX